MNYFNQLVILTSVALFNNVFGMEKRIVARLSKDFVRFDDKEIVNNRYIKSSIDYYKGDHANKDDKGAVLFPMESLEFIPIESCGEKRFIVTTPIKGKKGSVGHEAMIINPAITHVTVVTGIASGCRVKVYIGLNINPVDSQLCEKIYPAYAMVLLTRDKSDCLQYYIDFMSDQVAHFWTRDIRREAKKYLSPYDHEWGNPLFQAKVKELLGKRAHEFHFESQGFFPSVTYCTEKEIMFKNR
jgi:hypothetical protein